MKGMSLFTTNEWMLLLSARFVNVLLGALMAWVVLKQQNCCFRGGMHGCLPHWLSFCREM